MQELNRRRFLAFLGVAGATAVLVPRLGFADTAALGGNDPFPGGAFTAVRLPHDLPWFTTGNSYLATGIGTGTTGAYPGPLTSYAIVDDVVVPPEFERYVIAGWGDRLFPRPDDYVGYNCDYTGFVATEGNRTGFLAINHEYVSFPISRDAPETPVEFKALTTLKTSAPDVLGTDLDALPQNERWGEFYYNLGLSVLRIRRGNDGRYAVLRSARNHRLHGLSGLSLNAGRVDARPDGTPFSDITAWGTEPHQQGDKWWLIATGNGANQVHNRSVDALGRRIIGTAYNCSGATTPWGTILSCEENFQGSPGVFFMGVQEWVGPSGNQIGWAVGNPADPATYTAGALFGLVGEKYGFVVELDPRERLWRPRKHTALGRFRHENVALRVEAGNRLIAYMGDDRRAGHTWKFVSRDVVVDPTSRENSRLFHYGVLYAARFNADGSGRWIPMNRTTPVDPIKPSDLGSQDPVNSATVKKLELPSRIGIAGATAVGVPFACNPGNEATVLAAYRTKGGTVAAADLGDYYDNTAAVLMDCYLAANLAGATPTARPEDIEVSPFDPCTIFIAYTDGVPGAVAGEGYPDSRIFQVAKYTTDIDATQPSGGLYKIVEDSADGTGTTFAWERFLQGGEAGADDPVDGAGFANIDNLGFDAAGNLWLVTDMSTSRHNGLRTQYTAAPDLQPVPRTINHALTGGDALVGTFGNNWMFYVPITGSDAGTVVPFAYGPPRCEMTGPTFIGDTLIVAVQHPGEDSPINGDPVAGGVAKSTVVNNVEMLKLDGSAVYTQARTLPRGSNFPANLPVADGGNNQPVSAAPAPRPAVIGIRRKTV